MLTTSNTMLEEHHDIVFQSAHSREYICIEVPYRIALSDLDFVYDPMSDRLTLNDAILQLIYDANGLHPMSDDDLRLFLIAWQNSAVVLNRPADRMRPLNVTESNFDALRASVRQSSMEFDPEHG